MCVLIKATNSKLLILIKVICLINPPPPLLQIMQCRGCGPRSSKCVYAPKRDATWRLSVLVGNRGSALKVK